MKLWSSCSDTSPPELRLQRKIRRSWSCYRSFRSRHREALWLCPCSITTIGLSAKFGAMVRRFYQERIWLQALTTRSTRKPACREFSRAKGTQNATCLWREDLAGSHDAVLKATLSSRNFHGQLRASFVPRAALAERGDVPHSTVWCRAHGRSSKEEKAQPPSEEKALVKFLLRMSDLGYPVRIKFLPSLAFSRQNLASGLPETPSSTQTEKSQGDKLESSREQHL